MRRATASFCCAAGACLACLLLGGPALASPASPERLLESAQDPLVRETAAQVLGQRGGSAALPVLARRLRGDKNRWVRARCAEALGRLGDRRATRSLRAALAREKDQRVRRAVGAALLALGQREGVDELMWQLKVGTNHARAETMHLLVAHTGQALGQDTEAWWAYWRRVGLMRLALRTPGSPSLLELRPDSGAAPRLSSATPALPWRTLPAVVLEVRPGKGPLTPRDLAGLKTKPPGWGRGALLLLRGRRPLTPRAAAYLLARQPHLAGLGLGSTTAAGSRDATWVRRRLLARGLLVLEGLGKLDRLPDTGARVLLLDRGPAGALALALLP